MAEIDVEVKKWGDSLAVIIPSETVDEENLRAKDKVHLQIKKEVDVSAIFGIARGKIKATVQQLKNEARKGWD
ncbi:AbrB/MazE/SpoVT family DNA-binding domain-containing protein [Candidatus Woesearchaeota archaeon]|nr:AbrB/MazE/SpoVT family DNA-binding domain-containing protein [Candidatus Woesearchaeota archaeon]